MKITSFIFIIKITIKINRFFKNIREENIKSLFG
jgi:hypothetical protein